LRDFEVSAHLRGRKRDSDESEDGARGKSGFETNAREVLDSSQIIRYRFAQA
jgi:hypothetical protein